MNSLRFCRVLLALCLALNTASTAKAQHCDCHHGDPIYVPAPLGSDCKVAVLQSFGGNFKPDVPWFVLPRSTFGPINNPTTGPLVSLTHYIPYNFAGGGALGTTADNPAVSGFTEHANIQRYWTSNPDYTVVFPPGATATTPIITTVAFGSMPGSAAAYTWGDWETAVDQTFTNFSSVPTAQIQAIKRLTIQRNYMAAGTTIPSQFLATGQFVWSAFSAAPFTGPTGNGINEIILTDQTVTTGPLAGSFVGGGGITSMIVDPDNGQILECDVLISVQAMFQSVGAVSSRPEEWTALRHEIGHFFGLDHTNLHPGQFPKQPGPLRPVSTGATNFSIPGFYSPFSIADFPMGPFDAAGRFILPGMVGRISHCGIGFNHAALPLHEDDATSLSKIYPVLAPNGGRVPLINATARIIGRHRDLGIPNPANPTGSDGGVFARNVWVVPEGSIGNPSSSPRAYPRSGTLTGISRLSTTDCATLPLYVREAMHPLDPIPCNIGFPQSVNEPFFISPKSVVGATGSNVATGDFSVDGITGGTYDDTINPLAYEVVFEEGRLLCADDTNFAEWFQEIGMYSGNPVSPASIIGIPHLPTVMRSFYARQFSTPPALSGMRVIPGTVIALDPREHDDLIMQMATLGVTQQPSCPTIPADAFGTSSSGANYLLLEEGYTRPLIDIQPRNGVPAGGSITISIKSTFAGAFDVDLASLIFIVNNVPVPAAMIPTSFPGTTIVSSTPPLLPGQTLVREIVLSIPLADLDVFTILNPPPPGCAPNGGGLHFKVMADMIATSAAIAVDPFANQRTTFGRNDVIF